MDETRVERLLAMLLVVTMSDATQKERAVALHSAGFAPNEIAELLGSSPPSISQQLYEASRDKRTRTSSRKSTAGASAKTTAKTRRT